MVIEKIGQKEYSSGITRESFKTESVSESDALRDRVEDGDKYQVWAAAQGPSGSQAFGYSNVRTNASKEEFEDALGQAEARARRAGGGHTDDTARFEIVAIGAYVYSQ